MKSDTEEFPQPGRFKLGLVIFLLLLLSVLHFLVDCGNFVMHEFLFKATYLPIILGAIWFGLWPGVFLAALTSMVYMLHIHLQLAGHEHFNFNGIYLDLILYLLIGSVTGFLSDLQKKTLAELGQSKTLAENSLRQLEEKTRSILSLEKELERSQRLQLMGEMVAGLAHEIRTPLMSLTGAHDALKRENLLAADKAEVHRVFDSGLERIEGLLERFLDMAGKQPETRDVHLAELLADGARLLKGQIQEKNLHLTHQLDPKNLIFRTDPSQLQQIFSNLLLNAIQASPEKGCIEIGARFEAGVGFNLRVRDHGPGVPPDLAEKIFQPFFTNRKGGRGLGLPICRRLASNLNGRLELLDTAEQGAIFELWIPAT